MKTLLLLHGAIGSKAQLQPLADALSPYYEVHTLNFSGHSGKPFADEFSMQRFVDEAVAFIKEQPSASLTVFGYSMGGYVAMLLAKQHPELVERVVTLGTKFHWDEATAAKECRMLQADVIAQKVPKFATALAQLHGDDVWKELLARTTKLLTGLGKNNALSAQDYQAIETPVLVLRGDRDAMVSLEETVAAYEALPDALLGILPGTPHPIEKAPIPLLVQMVRDFVG